MTGVPLTRKQLVLVAVALAALTVATVGQGYANWLGAWGETSAMLATSTILSYPVVAGVAAWFTSAAGRQRYQWMLASAARPSHSVHVRMAATQAALASVGFLAAAVLAVIATATQATFGSFPAVALFTVVAGFLAAAGLGVLLATLLPSAVSPIAALVLVYALEVVADPSKPSLRPLTGLLVAQTRDRTYLTEATWMLGLRGVWLLALALVFVAIAARARSKAFLPFTVACLTAVPLLLVGDSGMTVNRAALRPVCHHPDPQVTVCLSAALDHAYPSVWSALEPELDLMAGLAGRQWHLTEEGVADQLNLTYDDDGTVSVPFGIPNGVNGNAHVVDRQELQAQFSSRVLQASCGGHSTTPSGQLAASPQDVIEAWILTELGVPIDGSRYDEVRLGPNSLDYTSVDPFRQRWTSMSKDERRAWFVAHGEELVRCQLETDDVLRP